MIEWMSLLQIITNGLLTGGIYGLAALGLSLIWGVMKVVNIAHGAFIMIGAYLSYWLFTLLGLHPLASIVPALIVGFVIGIGIYRFFINRIIENAANEHEMELMNLLFTFALSILIYGSAVNLWGADLRGIPLLLPTISLGEIDIPSSKLIAFITALLLGTALYIFLKKTYIGKAIRAVTQSRDASMVSGINPVRIFEISFGIGIAYAMIGGVLSSVTIPGITPILGEYFIIKCFTVVVLGGLGNPLGTFAGGLILGLAESGTTLFASYRWSPVVAFTLLIFILIFKPAGIFRAMRE